MGRKRKLPRSFKVPEWRSASDSDSDHGHPLDHEQQRENDHDFQGHLCQTQNEVQFAVSTESSGSPSSHSQYQESGGSTHPRSSSRSTSCSRSFPLSSFDTFDNDELPNTSATPSHSSVSIKSDEPPHTPLTQHPGQHHGHVQDDHEPQEEQEHEEEEVQGQELPTVDNTIDPDADPDDPNGPDDDDDDNDDDDVDEHDDDDDDDDDMDMDEIPEYFHLLQTLSQKWLDVELTHNVSKSASNAFWNLAKTHFHSLFIQKQVQGISKKTPMFTHLRNKLYDSHCLPVNMEFGYVHKRSGQLSFVTSEKTPLSRFPTSTYKKVFEVASLKVIFYSHNIDISLFSLKYEINYNDNFYLNFYPLFQVDDILQLHSKVCPRYNQEPTLMLSLDGVSESKSTSVSLDVYSCNVKNCRNIYPLRIVRPVNKFKVDNVSQFENVLNDLKTNHCELIDFVADNPKRATVREATQHGSYYACEYCSAKASLHSVGNTASKQKSEHYKKQIKDIEKQIEEINDRPGTSASKEKDNDNVDTLRSIIQELKQSEQSAKTVKKLVWPATSVNGPLRTEEEVRNITDTIAEEGVDALTRDYLKGFIGKSLLLDYPQFDFIHGIPTEYMHSLCLGVVKRMLELTFSVGEVRPRHSNRKLTPPSVYNAFMSDIKVPHEFSRRARQLDFGVLKAQEMRNIILFFFPLIVQCMEPTAKKRKLWLLLAYVIRSCCLSNDEFEYISDNHITNLCHQFYALYEKLFSVHNCTYNTHIIGSHLLLMRRNGPLSFTSAFPFESFYAELRHSFTPGTISPLKQMIQKVIL